MFSYRNENVELVKMAIEKYLKNNNGKMPKLIVSNDWDSDYQVRNYIHETYAEMEVSVDYILNFALIGRV